MPAGQRCSRLRSEPMGRRLIAEPAVEFKCRLRGSIPRCGTRVGHHRVHLAHLDRGLSLAAWRSCSQLIASSTIRPSWHSVAFIDGPIFLRSRVRCAIDFISEPAMLIFLGYWNFQ